MTDLTRSYADLFKKGLEGGFNQTTSFFSQTPTYTFHETGYKQDLGFKIDLASLFKVVLNEPIWFGIYKKVQDTMKVLGGQVYEIRKGKVVLTAQAQAVTELLDLTGREEIINNMIVSAYGLGLGGGIAYKVKKNGKLKIKFDPYIMSGFPRIAFEGDNRLANPDIQKVFILDQNAKDVYTFNYKDVYHYQFCNPTADLRFAMNGVVAVAKWVALKYHIGASNDAVFSNGMLAKYLVGLDSNKMQTSGMSEEAIRASTNLLEKKLREATGVKHNGGMIFTPFPLTFQDIQMNNSQMRTWEGINNIEDQIYFAMGVDKALLDTSKSKYNNIDQAIDQLYQAVYAFTIDVQNLMERFVLPAIIPNEFKNRQFIYRIPRQFTQEEIRIKEIKNKEFGDYFSNLKVANESLSSYNLAVLPTEDKLKTLEEYGVYIKTLNKETITIKPSPENTVADGFTQLTHNESVDVRELKQEEIDEVYSKYHDIVNMSASELEAWSENECSKNASLDRSPIERNLKLLRTPKSEWGQSEVTQANRTISFVSRMKGAEQGEPTKTSEGRACPSKRDISLKNWAYDPNKSQRSFYDLVKVKIDKSFQQVLNQ